MMAEKLKRSSSFTEDALEIGTEANGLDTSKKDCCETEPKSILTQTHRKQIHTLWISSSTS